MNDPSRTDIVQVALSDIGGGAERIARDLHVSALARGELSHLAVGYCRGSLPALWQIPNDEERSAWARTLRALPPQLPAPPAEPSRAAITARRLLNALAEPGRAWRRTRGYEDFDFPGTPRIPEAATTAPDVLHLHNLHGGYFDLRCLPSLTAAFPTVITLHDTWLTSGHCAYTLECERWRSGCGQCPHLDTYPPVPRDRTAENLVLKRDILRRSRLHVVGPSEWVLGKVGDSILADAVLDVRHVPNGVDQSIFRPSDRAASRRELGLPADVLVLVFAVSSTGNRYKDVGTLTAALRVIGERIAPRRVLLVALGADEHSSLEGVPDVLPVPFTNDSRRVATYLTAADLYVHAARAENHPLAILEALSCGVPVVASDVGGVRETLEDGASGLLVPAEDVGAFAEAVASLLGDDDRRAAMASRAAELARERFGLDRMVDAYLNLYREIGLPVPPTH